MKICPNCGKQLPNQVKFCSGCGQKMESAQWQDPELTVLEEENLYGSDHTPHSYTGQRSGNVYYGHDYDDGYGSGNYGGGNYGRGNKNKTMIIAIICLCVAIVLMGIAIVVRSISGSHSSKEKEKATEATTEVTTEAATEATTEATTQATTEATTQATTEEIISSDIVTTEEKAETGYAGSIFPNSSDEYLSESQLYNLSAWDIKVARNEIFARHGLRFNTPELQEHFNNCSWYSGTIPAGSDITGSLNSYEKENVEMIRDYENRMGINQ